MSDREWLILMPLLMPNPVSDLMPNHTTLLIPNCPMGLPSIPLAPPSHIVANLSKPFAATPSFLSRLSLPRRPFRFQDIHFGRCYLFLVDAILGDAILGDAWPHRRLCTRVPAHAIAMHTQVPALESVR